MARGTRTATAAETLYAYRWVILFGATASQTTASTLLQGIQPLGPFIQPEFGLSRAGFGALVATLNIGSLLTIMVIGRAVDSFGERPLLLFGGLTIGLFSALGALAPSALWLGLPLFIAGIGSSAITPAGSKAVMTWFDLRSRGLAMGIRQTGIPLGGILGALLLPNLALAWGWRSALVVAGLIAGAGGLLCYAIYRDHPSDRTAGKPVRRSIRQLAFSRNLLAITGMGSLFVVGQFALVTFLVLYLEENGYGVALAGGLLAIGQLGGLVGRVLWGLISDRFFGGARKPPLVLIGVISTAMALTLGLLPTSVPVEALALVVFLYGFSVIGWHGLFVTVVSELAGRDSAGSALGFSLTFLQFSIIISPPAFGLLVDLTHSYPLGWQVVAGLMALGTVWLAALLREDWQG